MPTEVDFCIPVPSTELLEALIEAPLPQGLREVAVTRAIIRDTYFDTDEEDLRARNLACRLRMVEGEGPSVILTHTESGAASNGVSRSSFQTPAIGSGFYETLRGQSELSARVREIVEPTSLRPTVAVHIERTVREARGGLIRKSQFQFLYDRLTVQVRATTNTFQELTIRRLQEGGPTLRGMASELRAFHGLEPDGLDTLQRALRELSAVRAEVISASAPATASVALLALKGDELALRGGSPDLRVPVRRGSGRGIASEILESELGLRAPDLTRLGYGASRRGGEPLELWLAEACTEIGGGGAPAGRETFWFPLHELMERVGSPGLRDPALLSVLLRLDRSVLSTELGTAGPSGQAMLRVLPLSPDISTMIDPASPNPDQFLNPDLSSLEFDERVLELAEDPDVPLLERVGLLAAFSQNVDEFFAVRVAALKRLLRHPAARHALDGFLPQELLDVIGVRLKALTARQNRILFRDVRPALAEQGIHMRSWSQLGAGERQALGARFDAEIQLLLTPVALGRGGLLSATRVSGSRPAVLLELYERDAGERRFSHVVVPPRLPRYLSLEGGHKLVAISEIIRAKAADLFPGAQVLNAYLFRISGSGHVTVSEESAGSLQELAQQKTAAQGGREIFRVEWEKSMPRGARALLLRALRAEIRDAGGSLARADLYEVDGAVDLRGLAEIAALPLPHLRHPQREEAAPAASGASLFAAIAAGEGLLHRAENGDPASLDRFLQAAADDPAVVAVKATMSWGGEQRRLLDAVMRAREAGKDVSLFVELDSAAGGLDRAQGRRTLEESGIPVVFGIPGYRTLCHSALVVRQEADGLRRYVHAGTGSHRPGANGLNGDLALLSADLDLTTDVSDLFNELTGSSRPPAKDYRRLLVAPNSLLAGLLMRIEREIEHARLGRPGAIQAKLNGLTDVEIIHALYRASNEGVAVDLSVRGICRLRPGVPGLSERIRVSSILDRSVRHSRIYYFANDGDPDYYIGSADWRSRSLRRRIEIAVRVAEPTHVESLRRVLDDELANPRAWDLRADGAYVRRR